MEKDNLLKQLKGLSYRVGAKEREEERALERASKDKEQRATYILTEHSVERLKLIAKESNRKIKEVAQEAIDNFIKEYDNEK